jgi:hypothetical protein
LIRLLAKYFEFRDGWAAIAAKADVRWGCCGRSCGSTTRETTATMEGAESVLLRNGLDLQVLARWIQRPSFHELEGRPISFLCSK